MIQFACDSCLAVKGPADIWILGLAAEALGVTAARREVAILSTWDRERAVHPLAVHFCSEACKDRYVAALFGEEPAAQETVVEEKVVRATAKPKLAARSRAGKLPKARRRKSAA